MPIEFWNDPDYKPKTKLGDVFWDDFLINAKLLYAFHAMQKPKLKDCADGEQWTIAMHNWNKKAPTIYSVFNKIRQDLGELPYSKRFIEKIDEQIEIEYDRGSGKLSG